MVEKKMSWHWILFLALLLDAGMKHPGMRSVFLTAMLAVWVFFSFYHDGLMVKVIFVSCMGEGKNMSRGTFMLVDVFIQACLE